MTETTTHPDVAPVPGVEERFHADMLAIFSRCGTELEPAYWPRYFLRAVHERGGVAEAKRLLAKEETTGYDRLRVAGRLDLSVEALVTSSMEYQALFTYAELSTAFGRLARRSEPVVQ